MSKKVKVVLNLLTHEQQFALYSYIRYSLREAGMRNEEAYHLAISYLSGGFLKAILSLYKMDEIHKRELENSTNLGLPADLLCNWRDDAKDKIIDGKRIKSIKKKTVKKAVSKKKLTAKRRSMGKGKPLFSMAHPIKTKNKIGRPRKNAA